MASRSSATFRTQAARAAGNRFARQTAGSGSSVSSTPNRLASATIVGHGLRGAAEVVKHHDAGPRRMRQRGRGASRLGRACAAGHRQFVRRLTVGRRLDEVLETDVPLAQIVLDRRRHDGTPPDEDPPHIGEPALDRRQGHDAHIDHQITFRMIVARRGRDSLVTWRVRHDRAEATVASASRSSRRMTSATSHSMLIVSGVIRLVSPPSSSVPASWRIPATPEHHVRRS